MTTQRLELTIAIGFAALLLSAACGDEAAPSQPSGGSGSMAPPLGASGSSSSANAGAGGGAKGAAGGSAGSPAPNTTGGNSGAGNGRGGVGATGGAGGGGNAGAAGSGTTGPAGSSAPPVETMPVLYWLNITSNRVMRSTDLMTEETLVMRTGTAPDGVAVDVAGGKIYWTNMGSLLGTGGGSLQRANLDGSGVETIVPAGLAQTPKQMQVDLVNRHVYFCDREGAKVWRAGMDGSNPEAIVSGHGFRELVGIALDVANGKFYFGDRIGRKILRANIQMPAGQNGGDRTDIEELFLFDSGAMPIDLDIDHDKKMIYWTDRQLGTVQRAGLDIPAGKTSMNRDDAETVIDGLVEPIGISLDPKNDKMYFGELGGQISESALDGSGERMILSAGSATGIAIAHLPKP